MPLPFVISAPVEGEKPPTWENFAFKEMQKRLEQTPSDWAAVKNVCHEREISETVADCLFEPDVFGILYPQWEINNRDFARDVDAALLKRIKEWRQGRTTNKKNTMARNSSKIERFRTDFALAGCRQPQVYLPRPPPEPILEPSHTAASTASSFDGLPDALIEYDDSKINPRTKVVPRNPFNSLKRRVSSAPAEETYSDLFIQTEKPKHKAMNSAEECQCVECAVTDETVQNFKLDDVIIIGKRMTVDQLRDSILQHKKSRSQPTQGARNLIESHMVAHDFIEIVLEFQYTPKGIYEQQVTTEYNIGILKWVGSAIKVFKTENPESNWSELWQTCFIEVMLQALPKLVGKKIESQGNNFKQVHQDMTVGTFYPEYFERILEKAGMNMEEWNKKQSMYFPSLSCLGPRDWTPSRESAWFPKELYDVNRYWAFPLDGTPEDVWNEWCVGLWGQNSVCNYEKTQWKFRHNNLSFSFKDPDRQAILELITFGVAKKRLHPQLIVDFLQFIMFANMITQMSFLVENKDNIAKRLYRSDWENGTYGMSIPEMLECDDFYGIHPGTVL